MAFCYDMISCVKDIYPNINDVCSDIDYDTSGSPLVHVLGDDTKYYTLVNTGEDTCVCSGLLPNLVFSPHETCEDAVDRDRFIVKPCGGGSKTINIETLIGEVVPLNEPCGENSCGFGYEYNPVTDQCENITTIASVFAGIPVDIVAGDNSVAYGWQGVNFYSDITNSAKPVREILVTATESDMIDNDGIGVLVPVVASNTGFWDNSNGTNGRLNDIGIWGAGQTGNGWHGFSECIEIPETRQYCISIGGDNFCRIKIDGEIIVLMSLGASSTFSFNYFHVFAITLTAGTHVIEVEGNNASGDASFGAEIYDATLNEVINWNFIAELESALMFSTKDLRGIGTFGIGDVNGWTCTGGYMTSFCNVGDPVCTLIETQEVVPCDYPVLKLTQFPCRCFEVVDGSELEGEFVTVEDQFDDCRDCFNDVGKCDDSERTIAFALKIKLPEDIIPDRGLKECCYDNLVLANDSNLYWENDFNSVYFKRQLPSDTCDFILVQLSTGNEYDLNNSIYGSFFDFGDFPNQLDLKVYRLEWKKVLSLLGSGLYRIKKEVIIAGLTFDQLSNTYHLEEFTHERAEATVRIDTVMDGELVHLGVGFRGTDFTTSMRIKGWFGKRNPTYTEDSLVKRSYKVEQISMSLENEYKFETGLLPVCITDELYDFMLFGNEIFINDYNKFNSSYKYLKFAVELSGNKGAKYFVRNRDSTVSLTFKDRVKNKRKLNC